MGDERRLKVLLTEGQMLVSMNLHFIFQSKNAMFTLHCQQVIREIFLKTQMECM